MKTIAADITAYAYCHAPHPDRRRKGDACGSLMAHAPAAIVFVTTSEEAPNHLDGTIWLKCPRRNCGMWNRFRIVPLGG